MYLSLDYSEADAILCSLNMLKVLKELSNNGYSIGEWDIKFNPDAIYNEEENMLEGILSVLFPGSYSIEFLTDEEIENESLKEAYFYNDELFRIVKIESNPNERQIEKIKEIANNVKKKLSYDEYIMDILINKNEIVIVNGEIYPLEMCEFFLILLDIAKVLKEE